MRAFLAWLALTCSCAAAQNSAASALQSQAEEARTKGDPAAIKLYQRALTATPDWKEGWWALGSLEYGKDHFPECREAFRKLTELAPRAGGAFGMLGLCEVGAKDYVNALEHLRAGKEFGFGSDALEKTGRYHLARLYTKSGDFESALRVIAELGENTQESAAFVRLAGIAALWKPLFPEEVPAADQELVYLAGKAFWHAFARNAATAETELSELAERYPREKGVHYLFGSFELRNNPDKAVTEFETELKIDPTHSGALSALAAEYLRRKDPEKGIPYARELGKVMPASPVPHTLLGRLLAESGENKEAVAELEKARDMSPDDPQPRITLASVYAKLGRSADAARERAAFTKLNAARDKDK
ncbi:MAG TPA: tetratricopeptide repeat protein [Bryobacteraceae bacterium]|nr:tetratricopeptide repeat protein [Bryobacteraceae bacterium]